MIPTRDLPLCRSYAAPAERPRIDLASGPGTKAIQAEADAFLDQKAKQLSETTPDVPLHVLRNLLTIRTYGCQCKAVLNNSAEPCAAQGEGGG